MLKKINTWIGIFTLIVVVVLVPLKKFNIVSSIPDAVNYWPILLVLMGAISIIANKKTSIENLSVLFVGLWLLFSKLSFLVW